MERGIKSHPSINIWRGIDDEDIGKIVDFWLARARRNAESAAHVRALVERYEQLGVALIVLPRAAQTIYAVRDGGGLGGW